MPSRKNLTDIAAGTVFDLFYDGQIVLNEELTKDNIALIGPAEEVTECFAQLLRQADLQRLPIFLLGTQEDSALLDLPEILKLNLVRCILLPTLNPTTDPATLRAALEKIKESVRVHFPTQSIPILLFTGRNLGQHWIFLLGRVPQLRAHGITLISDITPALRTPIPNNFRRFIVWLREHQRYEKAVERWHRHDQALTSHQLLWAEEDGPVCYVLARPDLP